MDYQAVLNKSYLGILEQGGPSLSEDHSHCLYRGPDGRKCSIGQLIPDEQYHQEMDLGDATGVEYNAEVKNVLFQNGYTDLEFLSDLQKCHDTAAGSETFLVVFSKKIKELAQKHNLKFPGDLN